MHDIVTYESSFVKMMEDIYQHIYLLNKSKRGSKLTELGVVNHVS